MLRIFSNSIEQYNHEKAIMISQYFNITEKKGNLIAITCRSQKIKKGQMALFY